MQTALIGNAGNLEPRGQADLILETDHRIANSLAIIAGLVRSEISALSACKPAEPISIRRSLLHLSLRIDALGRLHRLLMDPGSSGMVEFSVHLREIIDAAEHSLINSANQRITFNCENGIAFSAKRARLIGSFIVEAIINSLKHSHPADGRGAICIDCKRTSGDRLVIEVKDNGQNQLPILSVDERPVSGMGSRLMRSFAESLCAELEVADTGTAYAIRLQLPISESGGGRLESKRQSDINLICPGGRKGRHSRSQRGNGHVLAR